MNIPIQAPPVVRDAISTDEDGISPSGQNTQCCPNGSGPPNCMHKYCFFGMSSMGCNGANPYIDCIG